MPSGSKRVAEGVSIQLIMDDSLHENIYDFLNPAEVKLIPVGQENEQKKSDEEPNEERSKYRFNIPDEEWRVEAKPGMKVGEMKEMIEDMFNNHATKLGLAMELEVHLLFNPVAPKALNLNASVEKHFNLDDNKCTVVGEVIDGRPQKEESEKIPVTILSGFLGAGKTTLLNYILKENHGKKIAVIENEFGEVPIDKDLINGEHNKLDLAESIVVMDNGCICCTMRGDLIQGIETILASGKPDMIVVETTGLADPVPIVKTFMENASVHEECRLNGVLTLADAKNLIGRLDAQVEDSKINEAYQQIAFADLILLNKIDTVEKEELISVRNRIRSINAFAKIIPTEKSRMDLKELSMNAHSLEEFDVENFGKSAEEPVQEAPPVKKKCCSKGVCSKKMDKCPPTGLDQKKHDNRINSFSIVEECELDKKGLREWMHQLTAMTETPEKGEIFRIKGIFAMRGMEEKIVIHAVMDSMNEEMIGEWAEGEKRVCKVVFIGKSLDKEYITAGFRNAIYEEGKVWPIAVGASVEIVGAKDTKLNGRTATVQERNGEEYIIVMDDDIENEEQISMHAKNLFELESGDEESGGESEEGEGESDEEDEE